MMDKKILDEELKKEIKEKVDHEVKVAAEMIEKTRKTMGVKTDEVAESVRKKPLIWVGGAFLAGVLLGKLLSKK